MRSMIRHVLLASAALTLLAGCAQLSVQTDYNPAKPLPEFTLRAAAGLLARRGKGGRPKSDAPRCPCKAMTLKRALARKHKCEA